MKLEVRDPVLVAIARTAAADVPGIARLHETPWPAATLGRTRSRAVEVEYSPALLVTVRLVVRRGRTVIDVVRTVQRSVGEAVLRLTGLTAEVVVVVVDLD